MRYLCDSCKNQLMDQETYEMYCKKGNWFGEGPYNSEDLSDDYSDEWDDCTDFIDFESEGDDGK